MTVSAFEILQLRIYRGLLAFQRSRSNVELVKNCLQNVNEEFRLTRFHIHYHPRSYVSHWMRGKISDFSHCVEEIGDFQRKSWHRHTDLVIQALRVDSKFFTNHVLKTASRKGGRGLGTIVQDEAAFFEIAGDTRTFGPYFRRTRARATPWLEHARRNLCISLIDSLQRNFVVAAHSLRRCYVKKHLPAALRALNDVNAPTVSARFMR